MNLNNTPQLSIITINRNDAQGLEKTLESIWKKQSFKDFEHIIIDGASTDNGPLLSFATQRHTIGTPP